MERRGNIQCSLILFLPLHYQIIFSCYLKQKDHKVPHYATFKCKFILNKQNILKYFCCCEQLPNSFTKMSVRFFLWKCLPRHQHDFLKEAKSSGNLCLQTHFKHILCIKILLKWSRKPKYCSLLYSSAIKLLFISFKLKWK